MTLETLRCLDNHNGRPLCGAAPEGAILVDEAVDTTCPTCLLGIAMHLRKLEEEQAAAAGARAASACPETLAELGAVLNDLDGSLRVWVDADRYFRAELTTNAGGLVYGVSKNLPAAILAAFRAHHDGVAVVCQ